MPAPTYIISRVADPIFAVVIGVSAAVTRINREEKSKGKTTNETIEAGLRYGRQTLVCSSFTGSALSTNILCCIRRVGVSRKTA